MRRDLPKEVVFEIYKFYDGLTLNDLTECVLYGNLIAYKKRTGKWFKPWGRCCKSERTLKEMNYSNTKENRRWIQQIMTGILYKEYHREYYKNQEIKI